MGDDLKEKKQKEAVAAHAEKFEKFAAKEAVEKIDKASKLEKDAIREKEKAKHSAYVSQKAVDEKKRKQASKAVADAVDKKHEAAKTLREAFVKKAETQANVLLMHQEKARKIARRLDEANELLSKKGADAIAAKTTLGVAEKHLVDMTQALQSKESPEAKKIAQGKYQKARGSKEAALQANNIA